MSVIWFKIFRDLWVQRGRTLLIVLIIGVGAGSIGMIMGTRNLVIDGMQEMWHEIDPATINFYVEPAIDENSLIIIKREDGVNQIEGLNNSTIEWRLQPEEEWRQAGLNFRADYEQQVLNKLELVDGAWPEDQVMLVGQDAEEYFGIPRNGKIFLRANNKEYQVQLGGLIYSMFTQPAYFGGMPQFYASLDFYEKLTGERDYNQFYISTTFPYEEEQVTELADRIQERLEKQGSSVFRFITDPNKHYFQDTLDGLFFLLNTLGFLALILGLLFVYNTINAYISQQVDQIGIMKAIGARTWQVLAIFLITIFIYGLLSMLFALPMGLFGAWGITSWLISSFGADPGEFDFSTISVKVMVITTLVAPLIAALIPVISGARVTVREAISTYGLSIKIGILEKLLASARNISRILLLTISNTFRHKRRVFLLQIALVLSGLMFMATVSMRDSAVYSVRDILFEILNADITIPFERAYRIDYLEELTLAYPAVESVEMWGFGNGTIRPKGEEDSPDDEQVGLFGVPLPSDFYGYQLRAGRWLDTHDGYAIVLNQSMAEDVGVSVGDWVTINYSAKSERDWRVVGLVLDPVLTTVAMVPRDVLLKDINSVGRSSVVWIKTKSQDAQTQIEVAKDLRKYYEANHLDLSAQRGIFGGMGGDATIEVANAIINQFNFLVVLLGIMSIVIGSVGGIALSGGLSLSVMERRREIGVMRAIGASSWSITRLFVGEGLLLGWLSWLIALPLSIPAGQLMVKAIGQAFQIDLIYNYKPTGAISWFFIITILSIIASWFPARGGTKISVRESLAYQ